MARQGKTLPGKKPRDQSRVEESLFLQSAESLGRVIGSLQREIDGAAKRLASAAGTVSGWLPGRGGANGADGAARRSGPSKDDALTDRSRPRTPRAKSAETPSAATRKSKRTAKAAASKTAGRSRPGTRKTTATRKPPRQR